MTRTIHTNIQVPVPALQLTEGSTYGTGDAARTVGSATLREDGLHVIHTDGTTAVLNPDDTVTTLYAQAIRADDLQNGDELYGGPGSVLRVMNVTRDGLDIRFQLCEFDEVEDVTVHQSQFLELA